MNRSSKQRIALVAPFFGRDLAGRKERYLFAYATHLALEGIALEVITTTARDEASDHNYYRAGTDVTENFPVHRFRIAAPDRAAYEEAVLAARRGESGLEDRESALIDERLRSPELLAHVRASADRYDAFVFADATAATTVRGLSDVADNALLVPLLDDEPPAALPAVAEAARNARAILCTTEAEASIVAKLFGPSSRSRARIIGLGADIVPATADDLERVRRSTKNRPYLLVLGRDADILAEMRSAALDAVPLDGSDERDRSALFANAYAFAVAGEGLGFVPEVFEAWSHGKAVFADERAPGAAGLVREKSGGLVVPPGGWPAVFAAPPHDEALAPFARAGSAYALASGGWRAVAHRTAEAIDAIAAIESRSNDALVAHIAYLYPLVQRQRRLIDAMRVSRFWRLREAWFAVRRRFGVGPADDPISFGALDDRSVQRAALGDPYQLFNEHHRLRDEDIERISATIPLLPRAVSFGLVVDARGGRGAGLATTLASLRAQLYQRWTARVLVDEDAATADDVFAAVAGEPRIVVVPPGEERFGDAEMVGALDPYDRLEPHALFEFALALQDDLDVAYSDEDRIDEHGVLTQPWMKPDWSPETLLTRDYVGRMCLMRRALVEATGGVRDVFGSARWYDTLLRVTERTDRVGHIPQVLYHRAARNPALTADLALAVEVALRRRGEDAAVASAGTGVDVRFRVPGDERVCVIIPTRDRADLLGPCVSSLFERTAYENFDVLVIDNGSREPQTAALLESWLAREPDRFRVLRDDAPFNYSYLNNEAVRATEAPYVLLLNNDTEVIAPEWMESMLGQARRPQIGAVGAVLLYGDRTVQHAGIVLGILGLAGHAHRFFPAGAPGYHGGLLFDTNYLAVTGACLMVARSKFEQVGCLDETLAVSYNDVDLCLKLRRAGYRNVVVPRAQLFHYESKSRGTDDTPAKVARAVQEVGTIRRRWPRWAVRDPYYNPNLTRDAEDFELRL